MMNDEKCKKDATSMTFSKKGTKQLEQSVKQSDQGVKQRYPGVKQRDSNVKQRKESVKRVEFAKPPEEGTRPRVEGARLRKSSIKHREETVKQRMKTVEQRAVVAIQSEQPVKQRVQAVEQREVGAIQSEQPVKQRMQAVEQREVGAIQSEQTIKPHEEGVHQNDLAAREREQIVKPCEQAEPSNDVTRKTLVVPGRSKFRFIARLRVTTEHKKCAAMTTKKHERVLYPRQSKLPLGGNVAVVGGTPITLELAMELRHTAFGSASCGARGEWTRTALAARAACSPLAYGLAAARNAARSLLAALQAHLLQWLLFGGAEGGERGPAESYLRPDADRQQEALWRAISEVVWRCGGGERAVVALPQDTSYVPHSTQYYQDGVTEKLHLHDFTNLEDLQIFIKRYLHVFQEEPGPGAMLVLYAAILSRGCENVKKDLDGKLNYLVSNQVEGSINVVTLLLTGRATSYLHNGVIYVGDEDHYALPQFGILARSRVGFLVWYGNEDGSKNQARQQPGSRLKTPAFPIWVTSCAGHYGVLFNTNRELLRNYHAERRFDIHYYTCGGCHVLLTVDTRSQDDEVAARDDIHATPLERLIHTKWQDAKVTWTGTTPYVGEQSNN